MAGVVSREYASPTTSCPGTAWWNMVRHILRLSTAALRMMRIIPADFPRNTRFYARIRPPAAMVAQPTHRTYAVRAENGNACGAMLGCALIDVRFVARGNVYSALWMYIFVTLARCAIAPCAPWCANAKMDGSLRKLGTATSTLCGIAPTAILRSTPAARLQRNKKAVWAAWQEGGISMAGEG